MLKAEEQMEVVILTKHGESIRAVSRSTGRSRNTVRRYLRGGAAAAARKPAPKRAEKLDPYKQYIVDRMGAAAPDCAMSYPLHQDPWHASRARPTPGS